MQKADSERASAPQKMMLKYNCH